MKAICYNCGAEIILQPFCNPDLEAMRKPMRQKIIFDSRNQYDPDSVRTGEFECFGVGHP